MATRSSRWPHALGFPALAEDDLAAPRRDAGAARDVLGTGATHAATAAHRAVVGRAGRLAGSSGGCSRCPSRRLLGCSQRRELRRLPARARRHRPAARGGAAMMNACGVSASAPRPVARYGAPPLPALSTRDAPDHGGTRTCFAEVCAAWDVLHQPRPARRLRP